MTTMAATAASATIRSLPDLPPSLRKAMYSFKQRGHGLTSAANGASCFNEVLPEAAFKAEPLADFEIIHIAAHGIASAKFPDRAAIVIRIIPLTTETPRRRL